jgi:hypothetical protein
MNLPLSFSRPLTSQTRRSILEFCSWLLGSPNGTPMPGEGSIDWQRLAGQPAVVEQGCVLLLQFSRPLRVVMNRRSSRA